MAKHQNRRSNVQRDNILIEKALSGDIQAKQTLTQRISALIQRYVHQLNVGNRSLIYEENDFVQYIWLRLLSDDYRILKRYDIERGMSFNLYIKMITKREAINLLRKEQADKRGYRHNVDIAESDIDQYAGKSPEPILEARNLIGKLEAWLPSKLPKLGNEILEKFYEDLEPTEIATNLGTSLQVVYNWRHKIRSLSRQYATRGFGVDNSHVTYFSKKGRRSF
jgi:RNA polymerase sigma factor (sigma-70 family)